MKADEAAWLAFWAGFAALDLAADRKGHSLCTATRRLFRAHTCAGKAAIVTGLLGGAGVLCWHLVKPGASSA